jgi:hypothetical protein
MTTTEERDAEKKRWSERNAERNAAEQKRLHREAKVKRISALDPEGAWGNVMRDAR